jgi:hypothetical protein
MEPITIDGARPDWKELLKRALFARQEADLIHSTSVHFFDCQRLAEFTMMEFSLDEEKRTINFRKYGSHN